MRNLDNVNVPFFKNNEDKIVKLHKDFMDDIIAKDIDDYYGVLYSRPVDIETKLNNQFMDKIIDDATSDYMASFSSKSGRNR